MQVCRNAWPLSCLVWAGNVHWENPSPPAFPEGLHTWDLAKEQSREKRGKWDENDDIVLKTVLREGSGDPPAAKGMLRFLATEGRTVVQRKEFVH